MAADTIKTLRGFRQARQFQDRPVPDSLLRDVLEVGRWSGSARNSQPWNFVVVTDREQLRRLAELVPYGKWLADAPVGIALVMDGRGSGQSFDAGRVAERMMVAAHALGAGSGVATISDGAQERQALQLLGALEGHSLGVVLALGYPAPRDPQTPRRPNGGRRPLAELVHVNHFGQHLA